MNYFILFYYFLSPSRVATPKVLNPYYLRRRRTFFNFLFLLLLILRLSTASPNRLSCLFSVSFLPVTYSTQVFTLGVIIIVHFLSLILFSSILLLLFLLTYLTWLYIATKYLGT